MKKSLFSFSLTAFLSCSTFISPVTAVTWNVPGDALTIQDGINLASSGDTVLVACGTYYEHDIQMKSGVILRSSTGLADCVTIDAQQQDRVIRCYNVNSATCIEGLTITGGYTDNGGGLYCIEYSSPTIINCTFTGDSATFDGGGVFIENHSSPSFINCAIENNCAPNGGGGIRIRDYSLPTFNNCTVADNSGEGIWCTANSSIEIICCTFSGNWHYYGAGVSGHKSSIIITDCTFSDNKGDWRGGAIMLWDVTATFTNCSFTNNVTDGCGGAIYSNHDFITLTNCLFTGNSAWEGGVICLEDSVQGASLLIAENTHFLGNNAINMGTDGYIGVGSEASLRCCQTDSSLWINYGTFILDNDGCEIATESVTWGEIKALYR
jgi:parallel beta-helix repeat protein